MRVPVDELRNEELFLLILEIEREIKKRTEAYKDATKKR